MAKNKANAEELAGSIPIELSDDELDLITDGYIVQTTHPYFPYALVDNDDGSLVCRDNELPHLKEHAFFWTASGGLPHGIGAQRP